VRRGMHSHLVAPARERCATPERTRMRGWPAWAGRMANRGNTPKSPIRITSAMRRSSLKHTAPVMRRTGGITIEVAHAVSSAASTYPEGRCRVPTEAAPRTVRIAGALTTLQAVVGFGFVAALLIRGMSADLGATGTLNRGETYGEAAYYGVLSAAVLAMGLGLWWGKHWARTPVLLVQLLLIGAAWYAFGPSGRPLIGLVIGVPSLAVLWFLFNREGRAWSFRASTAPDAERK
jgi:hypothetical protein